MNTNVKNLLDGFGLLVANSRRFYGESLPFGEDSFTTSNLALATPQQALEDTTHFIQAIQKEHGCTERGTAGYCPVVTIGGSYPGWLSAMLRLRYPAVVDGAYSASAPMLFYSQGAIDVKNVSPVQR